jgi:spore coat protein U-like protein
VTAGGSNFATGTMYGLIPASQDVAPGSYTDMITVTVTY